MRRANFQTVSWFWDLYNRGRLDLDPSYQRRSVWNQEYKDYFIDTIILGYPAPAVFLHESIDSNGITSYSVVDGKQRLTTIFEFLKNKFPVYEKSENTALREKYFEEFEVSKKKELWSYQFSIEYLPNTEANVLNSIFDRINRNVAKLSRQELRHAKYDGRFIIVAESLTKYMLSNLPDRFPQISASSVRQMKDVEFVSLLLLLLEEGNKAYNQDEIDVAYSNRDSEWEEEIYVKNRFEVVIKILNQLAYDQTIKVSRLRNQSDFYTLFGVINHHLDSGVNFNEATILEYRENLIRFIEMLDNEETREQYKDIDDYYNAARSASRNIKSIKRRYEVLDTFLGDR